MSSESSCRKPGSRRPVRLTCLNRGGILHSYSTVEQGITRLATLVRVLMLVACLPLLQPTGFCICKAGSRAHARPAPLPTIPVEVSHTSSSDCNCRHCNSERPPALPTKTGEPSSPDPIPDDSHSPGCPASPGVDCFKWVEPVQSLDHDMPPVEVVALLPIEVVKFATLPTITSTTWPSSPPFYLTHCSLVI